MVRKKKTLSFLHVDILSTLESEIVLTEEDFVDDVAIKVVVHHGYTLGSRIGLLDTPLFNIELFVFHLRQDKVYIHYYEQYIGE